MYFPVAGIEVSVWVPPVVAFCVSFCTSMGGVSGAFLLLPFQLSVLGYASPSVSATNQVFNIVATPGGVWRYIQEKRMVWPLALTTALGTLPGVFLGAWVRVRYLPDARHFKLFAACVLAFIGLRLVRDVLVRKTGSTRCSPRNGNRAELTVSMAACTVRQVRFAFQGEICSFSTMGVLLMSFVVGIVGGVYGIGGGAIIAPFLVAFFGLPVYAVAGATLLGTLLTSIFGVAFYQAMAPFNPGLAVAPDWMLGALFGLGGFAGMYAGARCQKYVPALCIKGFLSACILFLAVRYVLEYLH
jgi:hypothetical protein